MAKRILALLTVLMLVFGCAAAETAAETEPAAHSIEMRTYPFYLNSTVEKWPEDFPLYFVDGVDDLPFVEVSDWAKVLNWAFGVDGGYQFEDYQVTVHVSNEDSNIVSYIRENDSIMIMNFTEGTILWDDYGTFLQGKNGGYADMASLKSMRGDGQVHLIQSTGSRVRHGSPILLSLADYNIPMIAQDGKYLLPLQTLSTYCLMLNYQGMYFNKQCLIYAEGMNMKTPDSGINELLALITPELLMQVAANASSPEEAQILAAQAVAETEEGKAIIAKAREEASKTVFVLYQNAEKGERSQALTEFSFNELCMELDGLYGQKDLHNITTFGEFFSETGLNLPLLTGTLQEADDAIFSLAQGWLDDNHTRFLSRSYLAESAKPGPDAMTGFSTSQLMDYVNRLAQIRAKHPEAVLWYYEEDDTAYLNMAKFMVNEHLDYYEAAEKGELPDPAKDTMSLIIQAHQRITRENSPIRNVVLDLSTNGGGASAAAIYTLCWFLGRAQLSIRNAFTGAETTDTFLADINLDHKCDASDTISHLNLYCLISPHSFSCGNLVPWAFKEDGRVTLLGKTSGGGACALYPMTTGWGTTFTISGPNILSFVKNGAFYSVDKGVDPDVFIRDYDNFFDRKALTELIHSLR